MIGLITHAFWKGLPTVWVGSSRLRGLNWIKAMPERIEEYMIGADYDALIFQKADWVDMARAFDGPKVYDICDLDMRVSVLETVDACNVVTCATNQLKHHYQGWLKDGKTSITFDDFVHPSDVVGRWSKTMAAPKTCFWWGYVENASVVTPWLSKVLEAGWKLTICANKDPGLAGCEFVQYENNVQCMQLMIKHAAALLPSYDIPAVRLLELAGNGLWSYKTRNKEYAAMAHGIPIVSSPSDYASALSKAHSDRAWVMDNRSTDYARSKLCEVLARL